jgi:hypothetical protein
VSHYKAQILACDFFTVETIWLQTLYVLFFIELGSRQVHIAGVSSNPDSLSISQQARQLVWKLNDKDSDLLFLIHDHDTKFSQPFDAVFESEGLHVIHTPFQAPNANAIAERWVRSVREECLDHILIVNTTHLRRVLSEYSDYYNASRPHQGIDQQTPIPNSTPANGTLNRRNVLGGIIHEYYRTPFPAALPSS